MVAPVKVLEMDELWFLALAPPMIVVVTVEPTVVSLSVRVRSHTKPCSSGRDTCFGEKGSLVAVGKIHCVTRLEREGNDAIVLRFSASGSEGRRSEEI